MNCRICNHSEGKHYNAIEMMFGMKDSFAYFECDNCGCLQIKEFPDNMGRYYPANYYSFSTVGNSSGFIKKIIKKLRDKYAITGKGITGRLLYPYFPNESLKILSAVEVKKGSSILDIGCGDGVLLKTLNSIGYKNLLGADPFLEQDIVYEDGLKIVKKFIYEVKGKWDIIMFHHAFEHIPNPAETLKTISEMLNPDGRCIIRIPTVSSYAWNHYGVKWVQLDAPRHFFLHSLKSMELLAQEAGLSIEKTIYDSTDFQFWGSEQYLKDIPLFDDRSYGVNPDKSIFSPQDIKGFRKKAAELNAANNGDSCGFILKKQ